MTIASTDEPGKQLPYGPSSFARIIALNDARCCVDQYRVRPVFKDKGTNPDRQKDVTKHYLGKAGGQGGELSCCPPNLTQSRIFDRGDQTLFRLLKTFRKSYLIFLGCYSGQPPPVEGNKLIQMPRAQGVQSSLFNADG